MILSTYIYWMLPIMSFGIIRFCWVNKPILKLTKRNIYSGINFSLFNHYWLIKEYFSKMNFYCPLANTGQIHCRWYIFIYFVNLNKFPLLFYITRKLLLPKLKDTKTLFSNSRLSKTIKVLRVRRFIENKKQFFYRNVT